MQKNLLCLEFLYAKNHAPTVTFLYTKRLTLYVTFLYAKKEFTLRYVFICKIYCIEHSYT